LNSSVAKTKATLITERGLYSNAGNDLEPFCGRERDAFGGERETAGEILSEAKDLG